MLIAAILADPDAKAKQTRPGRKAAFLRQFLIERIEQPIYNWEQGLT
jgi:hypothetical protein